MQGSQSQGTATRDSIVWMLLQVFLYPHIHNRHDANGSPPFPSLVIALAVEEFLTGYHRILAEVECNAAILAGSDMTIAKGPSENSIGWKNASHVLWPSIMHFALRRYCVHLPVFPTACRGGVVVDY
jgi:hypothetical protein